MTKIETLNFFEDFLRDDLQMSTEDFFSVSFNDESLSLQWNGRNKPNTFSDVVEKFDAASKFSYVNDYKCEWDNEHYWFSIEFTMDSPIVVTEDGRSISESTYDVRVVIH